MPKKRKLIAIKSGGAKMFDAGKSATGWQLITIERDNKMSEVIKLMSVIAHSQPDSWIFIEN